MAVEDYRIFNLSGKTKYIKKIEHNVNVLEIHEYCCDQDFENMPGIMAEGQAYEEDLLLRNFGYYCPIHNPINL